MIKLTIDNKAVEVEEGASLLDAATALGINIPTMCHLKGHSNHPSCMVCMVKDTKTGALHPSCAYPAQDGMDISTVDEEVTTTRKDALELLLSDHVGDCEAPCRIACPAFMDIPAMNRLIASGNSLEALTVVKEEIALPAILGYVCSAPCENACRRKPMDGAIAICQLKKHAAIEGSKRENTYFPEKAKSTGKHIAIVGSGVSGLSAAYHLLKLGHQVKIYESEERFGGSLWNEVEKGSLPKDVLEDEVSLIEKYGVKLIGQSKIDSEQLITLQKENDAVLLSTGVINGAEKSFGLALNKQGKGIQIDAKTFETELANVFACGSLVREQKMAIQALAQGKHAAYQMHEKLMSENIPLGRQYFNSKFGKLKAEEFDAYLVEASKEKSVPVDNELNGFLSESAIEEAKRCMHCDCRKVTDCKLRDYGHAYKVNQKNYQTGERSVIQKQFTHEEVVYESEKCIRCGLCVDITEQGGEELGLTYIGRGFDVRIGIPFNEELSATLSKVAKKCARHCPTGAIALK